MVERENVERESSTGEERVLGYETRAQHQRGKSKGKTRFTINWARPNFINGTMNLALPNFMWVLFCI
jgi:hypothetical protein